MRFLRAAHLTLAVVLAVPSLLSAAEKRVPYVLDESYAGPYKASFERLRWDVPILMRQTLIDLSVRLGINFEEDWTYPLTVRFVDGAPKGVENALAYVQLASLEGKIEQSLCINLAAYERERFDFARVLSHELVHAMVNDALRDGGATELPLWVHEGLAVYGSGDGDNQIQNYVSHFENEPSVQFLDGLDQFTNALDYIESYLAFKYVRTRHGINSLHNLTREIIRRKGDLPGAIEYTCFETWADFQKNAREFAEADIREAARNKGKQPY